METIIIATLLLSFLMVYLANSLSEEHIFFKLLLLFFTFAFMYVTADGVLKLYPVGDALETTGLLLFKTISWLYRMFVTYIFIYALYATSKWLGWLDGLRRWFK